MMGRRGTYLRRWGKPYEEYHYYRKSNNDYQDILISLCRRSEIGQYSRITDNMLTSNEVIFKTYCKMCAMKANLRYVMDELRQIEV